MPTLLEETAAPGLSFVTQAVETSKAETLKPRTRTKTNCVGLAESSERTSSGRASHFGEISGHHPGG